MLAHSRLLAGVLCLVLLIALPAGAARGSNYFKEGKKAEFAGDYEQALANYEKALAEDPKNAQYLACARRTRFLAGIQLTDKGHKLRDANNLAEALETFERAHAIDPSSSIAELEVRRTQTMIEGQKAAGSKIIEPLTPQQIGQRASEKRMLLAQEPAELAPLSRAPINLRLTNEAKMVFETVGKLAGINVLADPDFQSRRISVELNNVSLEEALDHVAIMAKSLWKAVTPNTILVYQESKRREFDPQVVKTVYLTNTIQPNELQEIAQTLRNLLEMTKVQPVNSQNAIVMKDTPDKVAIAEKLINDIDKSKPEVVLEVTVMQVSRDRSRQLSVSPVSGGAPGIQLPVTYGPSAATSTTTGGTTTTTSAPSSSINLTRIGKVSSHDYSVILPGATLNALMSDAHTKILQSPQVRASDGVVAKLRIGERIPIATGSFQPGIGGVGINPLVNTQFQYTDVGVILEITPKVHSNREISMKVVVEISSVTGQANIGGIQQPIIGQRRVEEEIRLKEGEVNILGGFIQDQQTVSQAGVPLLGQIPIIGHFFSTEKKDTSESETLIVLTPHIVRIPDISELNLRGIDVGTQTNIGLRYRQPASPAPAPAAPAPSAAPAPAAVQPPPDSPQLRFQEGSINQAAGTTFDLHLDIINGKNAHTVPLQVTYNPKILSLVTVDMGSHLQSGGVRPLMTQNVDANIGKADISIARPAGTPGVPGTGWLVTLTFKVLSVGSVSVEANGIARGPAGELQALPAAKVAVNTK